MAIRKIILLAFFLLGSPTAWGQQGQQVLMGVDQQANFTGTAIGSGYAFPTTYFMVPNTPSQTARPISFSYWITDSSIPAPAPVYVWGTGGIPSSAGGFTSYSFTPGSRGMGFINGIAPAYNAGPYSCDKASSGLLCARNDLINNGGRHHVCVTWTATSGDLYIDGVSQDHNNSPGTYTPTTTYWFVGSTGTTLSDVAWWGGRALSQGDCQLIYKRGIAGFSAFSGNAPAELSVGLKLYWPMNNCTSSGCPESIIGSSANLIPDSTPPTIVIVTPSPGTVSGAVSLTASCSDTIACLNVVWYVDGVPQPGPITTSPYTFSWNSANFVDGSHAITAVAANAGGVTATSAAVTVTTDNGTTNHIYYYGAAGSDTNVPCTNSASPCATVLGSGITFIGGDTIVFQSAGTLALNTNPPTFSGPSGGISPTNVYPGGTGAPITVTSDGTCNVQGGVTAGCAHWQSTVTSGVANGFVIDGVSNFIFQNQVIVGGTVADLELNNAFTIYLRYYSPAGLNFTGVVVQNNSITDMADGIVSNATIPTGLTGCTIQNNIVQGSTTAVTTDGGINITGVGCHSLANVVENINGHPISTPGNYGGDTGTGISYATPYQDAQGPLAVRSNIEFNATLTGSANVAACGNDYAYETYNRYNTTYEFNEGGFWYPPAAACDTGFLDIDAGSSNSVVSYNYGHNDFGPALNQYNAGTPGQGWTNNIFSFNISENDAQGGYGNGQVEVAAAAFSGAGYSTNFTFGNTLYMAAGNPLACIYQQQNTDLKYFNNICVMNNPASGVTPHPFFVYLPPGTHLATMDYNLYYSSVGNSNWECSGVLYTSFAAWKASACQEDAHGLNTNPLLNAPGTGGTVYTSGTPAEPQPAPSAYLLGTASPAIGVAVDLTQSPYDLTIPNDYYITACPGSQGGTGYNIGAAACTPAVTPSLCSGSVNLGASCALPMLGGVP